MTEYSENIDQEKRRTMLGLIFSWTTAKMQISAKCWPIIGGPIAAAANFAASSLHPDDRHLAIDILFGSAAKRHGVPSRHNPFAPTKEEITKPTADAINSVISRLKLDENGFDQSTDLATTVLDGSFVFFGGPVANAYSRHILGRGSGSPLFKLVHTNNEAILPVSFDLDASLRSGATVDYDDRQGRRPAWELVVQTDQKPYRGPVRTEGGQQVSDFLLLTSIPNVYSPTNNPGDRILVVSGAHGAGTRAIDLILNGPNAPKMLDFLYRETTAKDMKGWQALIPVTKLSSDTGWPSELAKPQIYKIQADFDQLHDLLRGKPFIVDPGDLGTMNT
jgi:hypothetical protein